MFYIVSSSLIGFSQLLLLKKTSFKRNTVDVCSNYVYFKQLCSFGIVNLSPIDIFEETFEVEGVEFNLPSSIIKIQIEKKWDRLLSKCL